MGLHIVLRGTVMKGRKKGSIEMYSEDRYMTMTGHLRWPHLNPIREAQAEIDRLYEEVFGPEEEAPREAQARRQEQARSANEQEIERVCRLDSDFGDLFEHGAWAGKHRSHSEGDLALGRIILRHTNQVQLIDALFRRSGLMRGKWDEMHGTQTYGSKTVELGIRLGPSKTMSEKLLELSSGVVVI